MTTNLWPSGDWGDDYEEGMRKLGIDIDATYDEEETEEGDEDEHLSENQ